MSPGSWRLCAFVLAATYFWSGLQKASLAFGTNVFPMVLHPFGLDRLQPLWPLAPAFEASIGLLLLFPRTRAWGVAGAVAMHAFLLAALGPWGRGFNSVVWPWNLGMAVLVAVAFFRNPEPVLPLKAHVVTVLAGALPALNLLGLGDDSLSMALYTGRTRQAFVLFTEEGARRIPPDVRPYLQVRPDRIGLDLLRWPLAELNVPAYPEERVYRSVARKLAERGVPAEAMTLVVSDRPAIDQAKAGFRSVPIDP